MVGRMDEDRDGLVSEEELQRWIRSVQEREVGRLAGWQAPRNEGGSPVPSRRVKAVATRRVQAEERRTKKTCGAAFLEKFKLHAHHSFQPQSPSLFWGTKRVGKPP